MQRVFCFPLLSLCCCLSAAGTPLLVVNEGDRNARIIDPATGVSIAVIDEDLSDAWGHKVATSADGRFA